MNHKRPFRAIYLLIAAWLAAGCTPTSQFPIVQSNGPIDSRLSGTWAGTLAESESIIHFFEADAGRLLALIIARKEGDPEINDGWMLVSSVVSEIEGHRFLSTEIILEGGEDPDPEFEGFHLLRYRFEKTGMLLIDMLDQDAIKAVIEAGDLSGSVEEGTYFEMVRITATSDELARYLRNAPVDVLFSVRLATFEKE